MKTNKTQMKESVCVRAHTHTHKAQNVINNQIIINMLNDYKKINAK